MPELSVADILYATTGDLQDRKTPRLELFHKQISSFNKA